MDVDIRRLFVAGFAPYLYHHIKNKPADSVRTFYHWRAFLATVKPKVHFFSRPIECLPSFPCGSQVPVSPSCPDMYACPVAVAAAAAASVASGYSSPIGSAPAASQASLEIDGGLNDHGDQGLHRDHSFVVENLDFGTEKWERLFFEAMGYEV